MRGKTIHLIGAVSDISLLAKVSENINGRINEGIMIDPKVNNNLTTEGRKYAKDNEIKELIINPILIKNTMLFLFLNLILQKISLPNVRALIKLRESIVDIIIAKIPVIKKPKKPIGRNSIAIIG